eukprot:10227677-Karenia_brevis.AAC.2
MGSPPGRQTYQRGGAARPRFFLEQLYALERENVQLDVLLSGVPRATATSDFDAFYEKLDAFSSGILRELAGVPKVIVAGGALVVALVNAESSDLDLLLVCEAADAESRLRDIYKIVQERLLARRVGHGKLLVTRSTAAVTFHHCMCGDCGDTKPVQVVLSLGRSIVDVLQRCMWNAAA